MAGNSFGQLFKLTSFGESHGLAIGGILDGCPSGLQLDLDFIQTELDRRKPGQSKIVTQRKESDRVQFLSGTIEKNNKLFTTGTPIGFIIVNEDQKSKDYDHIRDVFRPSHADFTYEQKYGIRDHKGGGRSSARETVVRVVAGGIAKLLLKKYGVEMASFVSQAGIISIPSKNLYLQAIKDQKAVSLLRKSSEKNMIRCPDQQTAKKMIDLIEKIKKEGDSIGGIVSTIVAGVPIGFGEPVFDKLHADIGKAMLSINAVKGFEYGSGFEGTSMKGSEHNDIFIGKGKTIKTQTNHSGGIQGGISNGENIYFNVAFKPVATVMKLQKTINNKGKEIDVQGKGRHDPCVLPRAVPIVEAMTALVLADHLLRNKTAKL